MASVLLWLNIYNNAIVGSRPAFDLPRGGPRSRLGIYVFTSLDIADRSRSIAPCVRRRQDHKGHSGELWNGRNGKETMWGRKSEVNLPGIAGTASRSSRHMMRIKALNVADRDRRDNGTTSATRGEEMEDGVRGVRNGWR